MASSIATFFAVTFAFLTRHWAVWICADVVICIDMCTGMVCLLTPSIINFVRCHTCTILKVRFELESQSRLIRESLSFINCPALQQCFPPQQGPLASAPGATERDVRIGFITINEV